MADLTRHEIEIRTGHDARSLPGVGRDEHVPVYQPHCKTCGWTGDETLSERAAQEAAEEHLVATRDRARDAEDGV